VALVGVNPALIESFVLSAHNDLVALALIGLAFAAVHRRLPWLAVAFAGAAGAVKIVFALVALAAFFEPQRRSQRLFLAAATLVLVACVSAIGGVPYLRAMSGVGGRIYESTLSHHLYALGLAVHAVSAAIAIAAIAAGLWFRRALAGAAWSFWTLSAAYFEWYVAWCLPYALRARPSAYVFLCAWPFAAMLIWHPIQHVYPMALVPVLVFGELALRRRRRLLRQAPA
jgi:hypothetical protein